MGLFNKNKYAEEFREKVIEKLEEQKDMLKELFANSNKNKIDRVNASQALEIPTFSSSVNLIANSIASLQIRLYEYSDGKVSEVKEDYRLDFLNNSTGDLLTAYDFKFAMIKDYLIYGDAHAFLDKKGNDIKGIYYIENSNIGIRNGDDPIFKDVKVVVKGEEYEEYEFINLARNTKNGVEGIGVVDESNSILTLAYNQLKFENKMISDGGFKRGVLKSSDKLSQTVMDDIKEQWKSIDEQLMILNKGLDLQDLQQTSVELQLNESKKINAEEISKLINVSYKMLNGEADEDTNNNFVNTAIVPILNKFQANINRPLLREDEKNKKWFQFDIKSLYKGDIEKVYRAYAIALKNGFMTIDEVRYREDLDDLDLNFLKMSLGEILYNIKTKEVYTPNTDKTSRINDSSKSNKDLKGGDEGENRDKK